MAGLVTKTHDKYKEMLEEWEENQISGCEVSMSSEELACLIDEFESLKHYYWSLRMKMGSTYGFRGNY